MTWLRVTILVALLFAAVTHTVLTIHQVLIFDRPHTGMTTQLAPDGMTVAGVLERDEHGRQTPAAAAGIQPGDRIDAIYDPEGNGGPIHSLFEWGDRIRMMEPGAEYSLIVFRRGGPTGDDFIRLVLTPDRWLDSDWDLRTLVSYLGVFVWVPILMILAGTLVGFLRPGDNHAFLAGVLFFAFSAVFYYDLELYPPGWREFLALFRKLVPAFASFFFLLFFLRFPFRSPLEKRAPWLKYVALGFLVLTESFRSMFDLSAYFSFQTYFNLLQAIDGRLWATVLGRIYFPVTCSLYFLGIVSLALNESEAETPQDVRRLSLIGGGSAGLVSLFILGLLTQMGITAPTWLLFVTSALVGLFPLTFVYAVIKHRVFGIRFIVRRGLQYALISRGFLAAEALLIFIALFFLAGPLIARLLPRAGQSLASVGTAVLTMALIAGLRKVNRQVMPIIDRKFFRDAYDARQILTELSHSIRRSPAQPDLLLNTLTDRVLRTLHPRRITIFLRDDEWPGLVQEEGLAGSRLVTRMPGGVELFRPFLFRREGLPPRTDGLPFPARFEERLAEDSRVARFLAAAAETDEPETLEVRPRIPRRMTMSRTSTPSLDEDPYLEEELGSGLLARLGTRLLVPLVTGGEVLGLLSLGEKRSEEPYSREDCELLLTVAEQVAVALDNSRLIGQLTEQQKLHRELEIAQEVQARLFPQKAPKLATLELTGDCIQAREVGGDYFDFIEFGKGWVGLVLADIAGKGISAALLMASLQANLRSQYSVALENLQKFVTLVNRQFWQSISPNRYATMFFGIYHDDTRLLRYVNCGHQAGILVRKDGSVERLPATGTVLGAFDRWEGKVAGVRLEPDDWLVIFSDGTTEARSDDGEEFGEERLIEMIRAHRELDPEEMLSRLIDRIGEFTGREQEDDMTLMVARACVEKKKPNED